MSEELQNSNISSQQLLQFRLVNNTNDVIPNVPFMTDNPIFNSVTQYQWALPPFLNTYNVVNPTITTLAIPALQAIVPIQAESVGDLTYSSIVQSITTNNYQANFIYSYSPNCKQVGQVFTYNQSDIAGNQTVNAMPFVVEPYQTQCSVYYYPSEGSVLFDGTSQLNFTMLPNTAMGIKIFAGTSTGTMILDKESDFIENPFIEAEQELGVNLFDDYCNYLIDEN